MTAEIYWSVMAVSWGLSGAVAYAAFYTDFDGDKIMALFFGGIASGAFAVTWPVSIPAAAVGLLTYRLILSFKEVDK